jgi:Membrane domain of glycerophosphoryl diester phosphodiesterase
MANLDLRPLSLGEILDRTFSIYRAHFLLFVGIAAIPRALILLLNLAQAWFIQVPDNPLQTKTMPATFNGGLLATVVVGAIIVLIVYGITFLYSQGAAVNAVSDIYLGRPATIAGSFRKMRGHAANLFGVMILNGLAVFAGFFVFIIGAFYATCRLSVTIPAAILEDKGPSDSLSRSWEITQDNVGRALAIIAMYFAISTALVGLFSVPFTAMVLWSAYQKAMGMMRFWTVLSNLGTFVGSTLATPVVTIATTVFYYDLRVRKEAFDLQMMMSAVPAVNQPPAAPSLPSPLS